RDLSWDNFLTSLSVKRGMAPGSFKNLIYSSVSRRKKQAPTGSSGLSAPVFHMIFQPHAGIEDVFQQVGVLHAGQTAESGRSLGQQQLEDLPHLFLVVGGGGKALEGVVRAAAQVPGQIVPC